MPPKEDKPALVQQEQQTEGNFNQDTPDVNERLARIEAAIERMAARPASPAPAPEHAITRGRARNIADNQAPSSRRSVSHDPAIGRSLSDTSNSTLVNLPLNNDHQPPHDSDAAADVQPRVTAIRCDAPADLLTSQVMYHKDFHTIHQIACYTRTPIFIYKCCLIPWTHSVTATQPIPYTPQWVELHV